MIDRRKLLAGLTTTAALAPLSQAVAHPGGDERDISRDPLWAVLGATTLSQSPPDYAYRAQYPAAVQTMSGREIEISGFITPLTMERQAQRFIVSRYSIECCPEGQPNEIIEVFADEPVLQQKSQEIRLRGRFEVQDNGQVGLLFRLSGARLV